MDKPMNYEGVMEAAKAFADSGFFPHARKPSQAFVLIVAGQELGFGSVAAMRGIRCIGGNLAMMSGLIAAKVKGSEKYDYSVVEQSAQKCAIQFVNRKTGELYPVEGSTFTREDAIKAGLTSASDKSGMYQKYGSDMLFARALTRGARRYCPDLFVGSIYVPEELGEHGKPDAAPQDDAPEPPKDVKAEIGEHFDATQPTPSDATAPQTEAAAAQAESTETGSVGSQDQAPEDEQPPAEEPKPQDAPSHLVRLEALCAKYKLGDKQKKAWCAFFQVERIEDLNAEQVDKIITGAEKRFGAKA